MENEIQSIDEIFTRLTKPQMDYLHQISENCAEQVEQFADKKEALRQLYKEVDKHNEEFNKKGEPEVTVKCKKGCSFCCNIMVHATEPEVDLIIDYMKEKNIKVSEKSLDAQSKLTIETYFLSPHKKCVFLSDEGLCKIYAVRPFSCRNYFVVSEPELCNTVKYPKGGTIGTMNYETFAMYDGFIKKYTMGNFARILLAKLRKKYGFFR